MGKTVSIIVPVYKVEKYIHQCIDSILAQSYANMEILLVDDGSPDRCGQICDEYKKKDVRINVIHKSNGGLSSARNAALDIASGEYILCIDSDDYIHPDMLQRMCQAMEKNNSDIVVCGHFIQKENKLSISDPFWDQIVTLDKQDALSELVKDNVIRSYAWGKLYKRKLFDEVRYPDGRNYEDIATTYLLFDKAEKIIRIPDFLYYYQIRDESISYNNSAASWHKGCHASVLGQVEREEYFLKKGYTALAILAMSKLVPYLYSDIRSGYEVGAAEDIYQTKSYLSIHQKEIAENSLVSDKDKKLVKIYLKNQRHFETIEYIKKILFPIMNMKNKFKKKYFSSYEYEDKFELISESKRRVIYFEFPCFDNLGDHAIAYASEQLLSQICEKDKTLQLYIVKGWRIPVAVRALKRVISSADIILCQGGGNFGNLYSFAQEFRRKILKTFKENKIIILPETIFYSDDEYGEKEKEKDKRIIEKCRKLTIFARDALSEALMKKNFCIDIRQMKDMVLFLDETKYAAKKREGIVLCLRSDQEGNLDAEQKIRIRSECEKTGENVLITDTCEKSEINECDRIGRLISKWEIWGRSKVVVTDRLHGMIFAFITKTPCIAIGNNHHKIREAYKTLENCNYIFFLEDETKLDDVLCNILNNVPESIVKPDFSDHFSQLEKCIRE